MELSATTIRHLMTYWYTVDENTYVDQLLDVVYLKKIVLPLQRAFFTKHGWPFQIYFINGQCIQVLGRGLCDEKVEAWMASGGKRTNPFHPQG